MLGNLTLIHLAATMNGGLTASHTSSRARISVCSSHFSYFMNPFYQSFSNTRDLLVKGSYFKNFLQSSIKIDDQWIYRDDITSRPTIDTKDTTNITITESKFFKCSSPTDGGVVFAIYRGILIITSSAFISCDATGKGGIAFFLGNTCNVTGSCFNDCQATTGFTVFCASANFNSKVESSYFLSCSGKEYNLYGKSPFLDYNNINISESRATGIAGIIGLSVEQGLNLKEFTFSKNNGKDKLIFIQNIVSGNTIISGNYISNSVNTGKQIYFDKITAIMSSVSFIDVQYPNLFEKSDTELKLGLIDCVFSSNPTFDSWISVHNNKNDGSLQPIELVNTEGCWDQSRYKWEKPPVYKTVIVGIIVLLLFVIMIIIVIVDVYKYKKRNDELEEEQKGHMQGNENVLLDDTPNPYDDEKRRRRMKKGKSKHEAESQELAHMESQLPL